MTSAIVAGLVAALIAPAAEAAPTAAPTAPAKPCTTTWRAVERVAVRRPGPYDGPVATMHTPIHHYLRKGEQVRSCIVAVARTDNGGPAYRACGRGGNLWRIVPGGQVPETCLRRA
ncbi:hypothetical protein [Streptomyces sp. NPDC014777]|uniref:hypothetical protein n=1 Tax=Streptomyces sp. NPDC014777 TaxID=3364910 RepID=UPI0036F64010